MENTTKLSDILKRDKNNFNLIRLIASLMVVISHSFALFYTSSIDSGNFIFNRESLGGLGVKIFFFLSGIYISSSFCNSQSIIRFIAHRIFRIWPGLIVCIVLTVFIIGPLISTSPLYFHSKVTWKYLIINCSLAYGVAYKLPGVFTNNYYKDSVNGSIWTLPIELRCYFIIMVAGLLGFFKRPFLLIGLFILAFVLCYTNNKYVLLLMNSDALQLLLFFIAGAITYAYRDFISVKWIYLIPILLTFSSLLIFGKVWIAIFYIGMLYGILVLGAANWFMKLKITGDYSYGVYIYGFLVQQIAANYFVLNAFSSMLITIPLTLLLAVFSWHIIELPSMNYIKKNLN